ncbi:MAG: hypothetical protein ILP14_11055 [Oscillospiraceae bacterium]|nr:hypothetical protein [Oscillospiraceae bacterium]
MSVFAQTVRIRDCDVSFNRKLRPSCLFSLMQEASIDHTEQLGAGRDKTLDRGFLWVLTRQKVLINRLPEYDERVLFESWPGETMHVLFPRYYRMLDAAGQPLLSASALWALIDAEKRAFIFPQQEGIVVPGETTGNEIPLPSGIRSLPTEEKKHFIVPYSHTDINGHMNNIRYVDECENMIPHIAAERNLKEITVEYAHEIRLGEEMEISLGVQEQTYFFSGDGASHYFSLLLRYDES